MNFISNVEKQSSLSDKHLLSDVKSSFTSLKASQLFTATAKIHDDTICGNARP